MGPPSYMWSVADRNVVMRRIPVFSARRVILVFSLSHIHHYDPQNITTFVQESSVCHSVTAQDSVLVENDAASLGNRFPTFRRDMPSSRYWVTDSRRFETTQDLRNIGIHHTTRRHIPEKHSPQSKRSFAFISFCKFNTPLQRRRRRLHVCLGWTLSLLRILRYELRIARTSQYKIIR